MNGKRKMLILGILAVMVVVLGGIGIYYWYNNMMFVSTEDAKVTGDLVKVTPQISGKLLEFNVDEGDTVIKDQIIGRQEALNLPDSSIDQSVFRAPISGVVIKKQGTVGEAASPGQTLAMLVDPSKMYISANIEETKLGKLVQGQKVDIAIDELKGVKLSGKVKFIGKAANSTFSILPSSTGGTFTKVVQKIPVKIELDKPDSRLLPGTNAVVKIHIR